MKPTISIFEDEIVITTDSFDLILKTGVSRETEEGVRREEPGVRREVNHDPYTCMGEIDWDNDPFAPSMDSLEKSIAEYKEQHPEQFPFGRTTTPNPTQPPSVASPTPNPSPNRGGAEEPPASGGRGAAHVKHTRNLAAKPCIVCGNDFKPTWNTQRYCPACKPKYYGQKRKPLAEQTAEELEKTLQEIEDRRKKPYEFK